MDNVYIKSIGCYLPQSKLTNKDVIDKIKEDNKNIFSSEDLEFIAYSVNRKFEFLGIEQRAYSTDLLKDSYINMSINASKNAIEKAGLQNRDIDCVICSGVTNLFREPHFALILAHHLGIEKCDFFDVNDTCNGFMKSLEIARAFILSGKCKNVLLTCCESLHEIEKLLGLNYQCESVEEADFRLSGMIVGSGAAAMILSSSGNGKKVINYAEEKYTEEWDASVLNMKDFCIPGIEDNFIDSKFKANARLISQKILNNKPAFIERVLSKWNVNKDTIDKFIIHQLGDNITFGVFDKLKIPKEKVPITTFRNFGNIATVNIPLNLLLADEQGSLKKGDKVLLISSACGLSYSLLYLEW
jgi:3-oxoacyl-[acyl-carrier-protein] synthase-3